jgi:sarcosine oxidase subunit alpha
VTARRLPDPPGVDEGRATVTFTFDGRTFRAPEGEPLAVALLAADRPILSRSFRFHRPRGLMCDTGQCGWCECEVDGRPSVRSCQAEVHEGLVGRSEHAWPSVERDLFGWLDLVARWIPPTFYHHRFLRPRPLRQWYLGVIRRFGGRGRLRPGGSAPVDGAEAGPIRVARRLDVDVLVVGGGRAGAGAADEAGAGGASVVLVEAVPGRAHATEAGVRVLDGASAVGWYDGVVTAIDARTLWTIRAASVVAATGSYERLPSVRGIDRPGVMGARLVGSLIAHHRVLPGQRALLVGDPAELAAAGAALAGAGASVVATVPTTGLRRILGRRRVTGAIVATDGREQRIVTDLVVVGDRSPNLDLVLAAGAAVTARDGVLAPVLDAGGRTTVAALSVVGQAAGRTSATTTPGGRTLVCFCEDVHADEIHTEIAAGYGDPELIKRRTGALTGPCQGKYCLQAFACTMAAAGVADAAGVSDETVAGGANHAGVIDLPTARPPLRPIRLGDLIATDETTGPTNP